VKPIQLNYLMKPIQRQKQETYMGIGYDKPISMRYNIFHRHITEFKVRYRISFCK